MTEFTIHAIAVMSTAQKHVRSTWLLNAESLSFFPKVSSPFSTISLRSGMVSCPSSIRTPLFFFISVCDCAALPVTLTTKQTFWQEKKRISVLLFQRNSVGIISIVLFFPVSKPCTVIKTNVFCPWNWPMESAVESNQSWADLCCPGQDPTHQQAAPQVFSSSHPIWCEILTASLCDDRK